jgi:hypothetical protein
LPNFGFPLDEEKADPVGLFKSIEEKQRSKETLTPEERSRLIFAYIFGSFGRKVDLAKAEIDTVKLLTDINKSKPKRKPSKDDKEYIAWYRTWQMPQILLGTIYAYQKEYIKAAYHLKLGLGDIKLMFGGLSLKMPYKGFIKYVFSRLSNCKTEKANYEGCGFSVNDPMGAFGQRGQTELRSPHALFIISRMQGINGEVIIAQPDQRSSIGYFNRVGSCGQPNGIKGVVDKYETWLIDKDYKLKMLDLYFNGYFETQKVVGEKLTKSQCRLATGFVIESCAEDIFFDFVETN